MNQWRKGIASWRCGSTLYLSVPFTWLLADAEARAKAHKGHVVAGGPAVDLAQSDRPGTPEPITWADTPGACPFDTLAMHNPCATFTTRGCPNRCGFCAVPTLEGGFRELATWRPAPTVCDNNLLAASPEHFERVIDSLLPFPACDFNQGLEAALFTPWHAEQIARLRRPMVRFAFDHVRDEADVFAAIQTARAAGLRDFGVYVLIGYGDTPEDALYRLEKVREWKIRPNPMRYQPLNATVRDAYVGEHWTEQMLRRVTRYYSKLRWLEHIPFSEYQPEGDSLFDDDGNAAKPQGE